MPTPIQGNATDALLALVEAMERDDLSERGWIRWRVEQEPDPYPVLAFAESPLPELIAAVQVAGLVPLQCAVLQDLTLYIDPEPAARPRGYLRDEDALPGLPCGHFDSLADILHWMTTVSSGKTSEADALVSRGEGRSANDRMTTGDVMEAIADLSLGGLWRAAAHGAPDPRLAPPAVDFDPADRSEGWGGRACVSALNELLSNGVVPSATSLGEPQMSEAQRAFVANLRQLQVALQGEVPDLVTDTMCGDNAALAAQAADWLLTFETQQAGQQAAPASALEEATSFEQQLGVVLQGALSEMANEGMLEVDEAAMPNLIEELLRVGGEAPTPKKMLRILVRALVDSDLVDEVYADDETLGRRLAQAFGR